MNIWYRAFLCSIAINISVYTMDRLRSILNYKKSLLTAAVAGGVLLDKHEHAKYAGAYAALKVPRVVKEVQEQPAVARRFTRLLAYHSFTQFLHEPKTLRFLKQECAKELEKYAVPLDL